jgi:hypothetical protein
MRLTMRIFRAQWSINVTRAFRVVVDRQRMLRPAVYHACGRENAPGSSDQPFDECVTFDRTRSRRGKTVRIQITANC